MNENISPFFATPIKEFTAIDRQLEEAVFKGDEELVRTLDKDVLAAWNKILDWQPDARRDQRDLVEFLLAHLITLDHTAKSASEATTKILSEFDRLVGFQLNNPGV